MTDSSPLKYPIVQISLDLTNLADALEMAEIAVSAGVDWLEAGTPLLLGEGLRAVEALHTRFPTHPIVADLKTMDGGYLEAEMMAKAGASFVVVMGRAHEATVRRVVDAARDYGIKVMGDNLAADDRIANAKWLESLGVDYIIHHIGYDERRLIDGPEPDGRARRGRRGRLGAGAGCRRADDQAGDRVPRARRAAGGAGRAAGHRRRRLQAGRQRPARGAERDLLGDSEDAVQAADELEA